MSNILRVGLVDSEIDTRFGRRMMIDSQEDMQVVFEEESAVEALSRLPEALLDVLVIDHRVRGIDGIELITRLIPAYQANNSKIPALILTGPYFSKNILLLSVAAGASDLVTLDSEAGELLSSIRTVTLREQSLDFASLKNLVSSADEILPPDSFMLARLGTLTEKESEVLAKFLLCLDDDQISKALGTPTFRIRQSFESILAKCQLATRAQLFLQLSEIELLRDGRG